MPANIFVDILILQKLMSSLHQKTLQIKNKRELQKQTTRKTLVRYLSTKFCQENATLPKLSGIKLKMTEGSLPYLLPMCTSGKNSQNLQWGIAILIQRGSIADVWDF